MIFHIYLHIKLIYAIVNLVFWGVVFVAFSPHIQAVSVAEQTQVWDSQLNVWVVIQELGNNLSGTASTFTFRVSTSKSNLSQFDFTAQNSRIYDKDNGNSYINACIPAGTPPADRLRGLTFTTNGVPEGFEDVTIDFSCRNYNFIPGHRYLIWISNANIPQWGGANIQFAASSGPDQFSGGGLRYGNGNPWDILHSGGRCDPEKYLWNDPTKNPTSGCNIWTKPQDDLYFVLNNNAPPPPPPKLPVIFIPGIGGSELKAAQDIIWSSSDGHGGTYSHAYPSGEKIWVNQDEAVKLGDDDYFDVLRLKADGQTAEASGVTLTGNLTSFGYQDIDSFFVSLGYVKGKNYFIFPYDWRKDVRSTKEDLDNLIETAKQKSGQNKVNLVVHSLGGLVGRFYISDSGKASKVNKLIELGVPHLGAVDSLKSLMYGVALKSKIFGILPIGIPASEIKDTSQNMTSVFQLLPSNQYFGFYNNSGKDNPYPFRDDRDIDNNNTTGVLNYDQTNNLLTNLNYNMIVFSIAEQFHSSIDSVYNQTNGAKVYEIVGSGQPTLGQIHETWWITWPVNLIPKTDEIFINGDGAVPLYSASLKNDSTDMSGAGKIYYVEQGHGELVSENGPAMQIVKAILNDDNAVPVEVKDQKIVLEGEQVSVDDGELDLSDDQNRHCGLNDKGEMEENIPEVTCTTSGNTKHAFVKKKAKKVKVKVTRKKNATSSKTTTVSKRTYKQDKITKTILYKDLPVDDKGKIEFDFDPSSDTAPSLIFYPDSNQPEYTTIDPTSEVAGGPALDQTAPKTSIQIAGPKNSSGIYTSPVTITLAGSDSDSGILKIEYSLDNGQTVKTYTAPFTISAPGKTTLQVKAIDKSGNEEIPQTIIIEITVSPSPTPIPTPSSSVATITNIWEVGFDSSQVKSENTTPPSTTTTSKESLRATFEVKEVQSENTVPTWKVGFDSSQVDKSEVDTPQINQNNNNILGVKTQSSAILKEQQNLAVVKTPPNAADEILGGLLMITGGLVTLASLGLIATFLKPLPK